MVKITAVSWKPFIYLETRLTRNVLWKEFGKIGKAAKAKSMLKLTLTTPEIYHDTIPRGGDPI